MSFFEFMHICPLAVTYCKLEGVILDPFYSIRTKRGPYEISGPGQICICFSNEMETYVPILEMSCPYVWTGTTWTTENRISIDKLVINQYRYMTR